MYWATIAVVLTVLCGASVAGGGADGRAINVKSKYNLVVRPAEGVGVGGDRASGPTTAATPAVVVGTTTAKSSARWEEDDEGEYYHQDDRYHEEDEDDDDDDDDDDDEEDDDEKESEEDTYVQTTQRSKGDSGKRKKPTSPPKRRRKIRKGALKGVKGGKLFKKMRKYMLPLLLAYKLKFFTLVPLLLGGLVLIVATTGFAGFFFALFAVGIGLKKE